MSEDTQTAPAAERAKPGKMRVFIGTWCEAGCTPDGRPSFEIRAEAKSASNRDVQNAIKALGYGTYQILTGRLTEKTYKEVKRDTFA